MTRISLIEAYDNRDVIAQIVRLRQDTDELQNILRDIDPNGDLTNVVTKTGDQTIDGVKTFIGKIVADCDIIQLGNNYETHAEQIYSKDDYIVMRDGAVNALAPGTYSGLQIKKYNGSDDLRLAADQYGIARLGDIGDEKPLMVRDEAGDMTSGNILTWDGVNQKAITSGKAVSDLVEGSGNIGDDTHPVKVVNGAAVPVTDGLVKLSDVFFKAGDTLSNNGSQVVSGFITGTGDGAFVELPLPKQVPAGVTVSIAVSSLAIRGVSTAEAPTVSSASVVVNTSALLRVSCTFSAAVSNPANSPFVGFFDYTLTFS